MVLYLCKNVGVSFVASNFSIYVSKYFFSERSFGSASDLAIRLKVN
jgi:hypothetical protein